jgi:hypothetical protein
MGKEIYTPELAQRVLESLRVTGSLLRTTKEIGIARETVIKWVVADRDGFALEYARAKDEGIDALVEDTLDIADGAPALNQFGGVDTGHVAHSKLRIETRRWLAERMAPKRYGLKQGLDVTNTDGSLQVDEATRSARVAQLLAMAQARKDDADSFGDLA